MPMIQHGGKSLQVFGPYRDEGRVWAVSAQQQQRWAKSFGARLPTPAEFDAIWAQADVRVTPKPRDVATAPLDALHDDVEAALGGRDPDGLLVVAGKTWVDDGSGRTANYGWHVPAKLVAWDKDLQHMAWRKVPVYRCTVGGKVGYVIQPVGHAHDSRHADYSQLGYCVREQKVGDVVVDIQTGSSVPPAPRQLRRTTPPMLGDDVRELQRALGISADGVFGPLTEAAVKRFQRGAGLVDDGVVGPLTRYAMAAAPPDESMPTRPEGLTPLVTNAHRQRVWGRFGYEPAPLDSMPEHVRITDNWPARQLVQVFIPQLLDIPGVGGHGKGPDDGMVHCHHRVASSLKAIWADWETAGLLDMVLTWGGLWCPRFVRGSRARLSNHAWGTAFDVNAPWNGLGKPPAREGEKGSVVELVSIAAAHGWYWGGWFRRPDGMHFEATEAAIRG